MHFIINNTARKKTYESAGDDSEVTIRTTANVEGGTTCLSCVDKRHAECNTSDCLCTKHSHVVN